MDKNITAEKLPVLPATHLGRSEVLVMVRQSEVPGRMQVIRLWASPVVLQPGNQPLWIGTVKELQFTRQLDFFSYWQAQPGEGALLEPLQRDLRGLDSALEARSDNGQRVLRLRSRDGAG